MRHHATLLVLVCALMPALARAEPAKSTGLQAQVDALLRRVEALEANDAALRARAVAADADAKAAREELAAIKAAVLAAPAPEVASATPVPAPGGANAFNPAISVILNGSVSTHSRNPDDYARAGFPLVGEGAPSARGISLGESEISLAANIDEKFQGQLTLTAESENGEDHVGIEEAYIDTTALPDGFNLRLGRFYSNIGYLNSHHAHTDNFFDRPLAYQAFLGNQYGDDGVQLRWLAPTDLYLEVGAEIFRGANYPSGGSGHSGAGVKTLFAHMGGDVGVENAWLAGLSMLKSSANGAEDGFSGDSTLWIADGTWKWAPQGNFKDGGITLRGEYFRDLRDGVTTTATTDDGLPLAWHGARSGAYLEGVYRLNRTWDIGYRVDKLWADRTGPYASAFDPYRNTLELTWRNSEFSLLRLQFARDEPTAATTDNALTLQYQVSLGAHGAHKF